jgi:hypothetical protein
MRSKQPGAAGANKRFGYMLKLDEAHSSQVFVEVLFQLTKYEEAQEQNKYGDEG